MAGSGMDHHSLRLIDHQNVTDPHKGYRGEYFPAGYPVPWSGRDFDLDLILFPEPVIGLTGPFLTESPCLLSEVSEYKNGKARAAAPAKITCRSVSPAFRMPIYVSKFVHVVHRVILLSD